MTLSEVDNKLWFGGFQHEFKTRVQSLSFQTHQQGSEHKETELKLANNIVYRAYPCCLQNIAFGCIKYTHDHV